MFMRKVAAPVVDAVVDRGHRAHLLLAGPGDVRERVVRVRAQTAPRSNRLDRRLTPGDSEDKRVGAGQVIPPRISMAMIAQEPIFE